MEPKSPGTVKNVEVMYRLPGDKFPVGLITPLHSALTGWQATVFYRTPSFFGLRPGVYGFAWASSFHRSTIFFGSFIISPCLAGRIKLWECADSPRVSHPVSLYRLISLAHRASQLPRRGSFLKPSPSGKGDRAAVDEARYAEPMRRNPGRIRIIHRRKPKKPSPAGEGPRRSGGMWRGPL